MTTTSLRKESTRLALTAEPHLLAGVVAGLASAVTWNALPLALFGLGSCAWLFHAATSDPRMKRIARARQAEDDQARELARLESLRELQVTLVSEPYRAQVLTGALPDVGREYRRVVALAKELERRLSGQPELELEWRARLDAEVSQLEETFLTLARWRMEEKGDAKQLEARMQVLHGELALLVEQAGRGTLDLITFRARLEEVSGDVGAEVTAAQLTDQDEQDEDAPPAPC